MMNDDRQEKRRKLSAGGVSHLAFHVQQFNDCHSAEVCGRLSAF